METEKLAIFDENYIKIGVKTRDEIHRQGYWHETFHCWFLKREEREDYLYFQLRSKEKKDYPALFDITAAGHLLENESVEEGVREVKEELGVNLLFSELVSLGVMKYSVRNNELVDNELANVFLYLLPKEEVAFSVGKAEVAGVVKVGLSSFYQLIRSEVEAVRVEGFQELNNGVKVEIVKDVTLQEFVPHELEYFEAVVEKVKKVLAS
ncbi:NUDIX hydrolase [Bacillus sp. 2205SS5-2]|uniref:NUDIX hydrolase n=1 Tax=Bacillus sp. 2205SS5-2 TaxID=3109031 RepID=UPI00300732CD